MNEVENTTLSAILDATKSEFLEKGFKSASLRNIVKTAGVTTGAIYAELVTGIIVTSLGMILKLGIATVALVGSIHLINGDIDVLTLFMKIPLQTTGLTLYLNLSGFLTTTAKRFSKTYRSQQSRARSRACRFLRRRKNNRFAPCGKVLGQSERENHCRRHGHIGYRPRNAYGALLNCVPGRHLV